MFRLILCLLMLALALYEISPLFFGESEKGIQELPTVGEVWSDLSSDSLQLLQPAIERHLWQGPLIWETVMLPLLLTPLWQIWSGLALIFLILFLLRPPRSRARF